MTKTTSAGVFQLPNGMWGFRYAFMLNGKQKDIKRTKDENGNQKRIYPFGSLYAHTVVGIHLACSFPYPTFATASMSSFTTEGMASSSAISASSSG